VLFIFEIEIVSFSSTSGDYISFQAPYRIFIDRSSIPRSLASDVQIHFIHLMCHVALMLMIFITFCVLNSIVSYGQSKHVIKVGAFDRRWFFVAGQNFHSITTVVPLHVLKSSRVRKNLTSSSSAFVIPQQIEWASRPEVTGISLYGIPVSHGNRSFQTERLPSGQRD
jgi:hypothetical protein